jgi:AraC-like DNA-binding protein
MAIDSTRFAAGGYAYRNLGQGWGDALLGLGFMRKTAKEDGRGGHGEEHYSAVLVLSGRGRYVADGRVWDLGPGSLFQRFPGRAHQLHIAAPEPWLECWVACGGGLADGLRAYGLPGPERPVFTVPLDRVWLADLARARDRLRTVAVDALPRMLSVVMDLLVRLLTADRRQPGDHVAAACAHLAADPRCELRALARDSGLSYERFRKVFTQATGEAPGAYRIRQRIDRARALLLDPGASVASVAESLGYSSPFAFSAQFRAIAGCSPTAWRQRR